VRLAEVSPGNKVATFWVDGKKYTVEPEETFATNFVLLRLDGGKNATVAYGSGGIVDMTEGETVEFR
jgi:hypothetical protein